MPTKKKSELDDIKRVPLRLTPRQAKRMAEFVRDPPPVTEAMRRGKEAYEARRRGRPPTGRVVKQMLLEMSVALATIAESEAKRVGVTRAEWMRRAVRHYAQSGSPVVHPYADED